MATKDTLSICNKKFGKRQDGHTPENAFRHALWNYLLSYRCERVSKDVEKATTWAKTFTDLHERFAPNEDLPRIMDLHNNKIGRDLFRKEGEAGELILPVLLNMMKEARQFSDESQLKQANGHLVYIEK